LTEDGLSQLYKLYYSGCYKINIPEEGALLTIAWLLSNDLFSQVAQIIDEILPYMDSLRFYPVITDEPVGNSSEFYLSTVGDCIQKLKQFKSGADILRQKETISIWIPLYDEFISHFIQAIKGVLPVVKGTQTISSEGKIENIYQLISDEVKYEFSDEWISKLKALYEKYRNYCAIHRYSRKPYKRNSSLKQIVTLAHEMIKLDFKLTKSQFNQLSFLIGRYITKHGLPESDQNKLLRARQKEQISGPLFEDIAAILIERLQSEKIDKGIENLDPFLEPLIIKDKNGNARKITIPIYFKKRIEKCLTSSLNVLVERGLITSADTLAILLPQLTAEIQSSGIDDPNLHRLYSQLYKSFRKRRSLLLLNLESQIKVEEVPWIKAVLDNKPKSIDSQEIAKNALEEIATQTICSFPHAIIPNKLLQEFRMLAKTANIDLPFVDEVAADIFMGEFSDKFLAAAKIASSLLKGTIYERYYSIDFSVIDAIKLKNKQEESRFGFRRKTNSNQMSFAEICKSRAKTEKVSYGVAANGAIIEQQQILTTQNLAVCFAAFDLKEKLHDVLIKLAQHCFQWICKRQQTKIDHWHGKLIMIKNTAYAWRQMIFYISMMDKDMVNSFIEWMYDYFETQSEEFKARFKPAIETLKCVVSGQKINDGRVFLGWTTEKHWLLS